MPSGRKARHERHNPLNDLQHHGDDDSTNQNIVGSDTLGINKLCLSKDFALQEEQITERKEYKQKSAGVSDESCGLLFGCGISIHFILRFYEEQQRSELGCKASANLCRRVHKSDRSS